MQLQVRLFAALRETAHADAITLDVPDGSTVSALKTAISEQFPALAPHLPSARVAASMHFVDEGHPLSADEPLALIPP